MVELTKSFEQPKQEVTMTDAAARRIKELMEAEDREDQALQLEVTPGGCAGFSYEFGWASRDESGNLIEHENGAALLVKDSDMRMLGGSTLDYTQSLKGSKFEVNNPNASSSCGCGKSFA